MGQGNVISALIGASNKARFPGVQGSQLSVNMFYAKNGADEFMESVPGLKLKRLVASGMKCRGAYCSTIGLDAYGSDEDLFAVFGSTVYRFHEDGTATSIGRVSTNNNSQIRFAETGGPRAMLLIVDGVNLWYYDLKEGGQMVSVQLPERITADGGIISPTHVAVVAGSIVVNDSRSGYVYYSLPYPLANDTRTMYVMEGDKPSYMPDGVTPRTSQFPSREHVFEDDYHVQKYFNTESSSDNINGLYAVGPTLYVFGPKTVEIWQRGSGEFEEWIRTSYTAQNGFGLEAPDSVASSGSLVYFVSSGAQYGKAVMMASGTTYKKISDDWLDEKLMREKASSAFGFCYSVGEHNFYVLQLPGIGETWVYDTLDGGWHQRTSRDPKSGIEGQWRARSVQYWHEKFWAFTVDGCWCEFGGYWSEDYPDGTSLPMVRHRQTAVIVDDLRPFTFEELTVECNVGSWDDYELQPKLLLEVSKDGGNTFGNIRSASMGRTGNYSQRVRFMNLGYCRLCVLRLTYSHPTEFVISKASVRAEATAEEM